MTFKAREVLPMLGRPPTTMSSPFCKPPVSSSSFLNPVRKPVAPRETQICSMTVTLSMISDLVSCSFVETDRRFIHAQWA